LGATSAESSATVSKAISLMGTVLPSMANICTPSTK
jgi:hypothetical protein